MADKISPPTKKVSKSDGIPSGESHSTLTTPANNPDGKYWGGEKKTGTLFGKK